MATRKVYIKAKVNIIIEIEEGIEIAEVMDDIDFDFTSNTSGADVLDSGLTDYEITDSK